MIVVDDASTDGTYEIAKEYESKYPSFTVLRHESNKGCGPARNTGLEHVTTDYVTYLDGDDYHFMDQETYDDITLEKDYLGDNAGYISPDDDYEVKVTYYNEKPVGVRLPIQVTRTITYCEPGVKGDTSGKSTKPATLDTGMEVKVPLFCNTDDRIVIDTRDGSFVERAKD